MSTAPEFVLTLSCPDTTGIVYHVTGFLFERGCNIIDSAQFGDASTGLFFMRVHFSAAAPLDRDALEEAFRPIAARFAMDARLHALAVRSQPAAVMAHLEPAQSACGLVLSLQVEALGAAAAARGAAFLDARDAAGLTAIVYAAAPEILKILL